MVKNRILKNTIITMLFIVLFALVFSIIRIINTQDIYAYKNEQAVLEGNKKVKIGFSLGTLKEERWIKDRDILMAKARELGADIIVQNANNDDQDQLKQVKYLLEQGIDVLIIVPNDLNKAATAVEMAKKQGVPVISYDRLVMNSNVDLYITFDNVKVGELMAKRITKTMKTGNLLIINGAKTDNNTKMIKQGYDKILEPLVEDGKIDIISEEWAADWLKEYAFKVVDETLQRKTKINAVIAGNDSLAEGVIEALSEHRMTGDVIVIGQDADLTACQRIVEGTQQMTIYKPIEKLAEATVKMAIRLVNKEPLNVNEYIHDGRYDVLYYVLDPIAVDKENIDETIIRDGFHIKDEVYRN
ncbi:MAG: monosaccharide-transporting ATPase [Clostridia bacterium]|nr:monosaccharide-transporting ATPase [Clostridia bacterium]